MRPLSELVDYLEQDVNARTTALVEAVGHDADGLEEITASYLDAIRAFVSGPEETIEQEEAFSSPVRALAYLADASMNSIDRMIEYRDRFERTHDAESFDLGLAWTGAIAETGAIHVLAALRFISRIHYDDAALADLIDRRVRAYQEASSAFVGPVDDQMSD